MKVLSDQWLIESPQADIIERAGRHGNALTIWHRRPEPDLQAAVASLPHDALPDGRKNGGLPDCSDWLDGYLQRTADIHRDALAVLIDDMLELAHWFDRRCQAPVYTFRCHRLSDTMCPRFHTDRGPMRLLCTYRGPGTEWVPDTAVNRRALNTPGTDNATIVHDPSAICTVPTFAAAILCGCDRAGRGGVVHRSPQLASGTSRFAFCMTAEQIR